MAERPEQLVDFDRFRREDADLQRLVVLSLRHEPNLHAGSNRAIDHPDDDDDNDKDHGKDKDYDHYRDVQQH